MKFTDQNTVDAPLPRVWDALLDPQVLVRTIPGCERLEALASEAGENAYAMTVTAGVAAIKGTYAGSCTLSDLVEHESLTMKLEGAGAPGTIGATVDVRFADAGEGRTTISYDADAIVGGMVGGVGQRMLTSVSKRMAGEFFGNIEQAIAHPESAGAPAEQGAAGQVETATTGAGQVFTAPPRAGVAGIGSQQDFLKGIAVGAGLVVLGVLLGRRR